MLAHLAAVVATQEGLKSFRTNEIEKIPKSNLISTPDSGGGGGAENSYSGGGGCFLKYTGGRQLAALDNSDEGYVIISLIGLPKEDPKPMKLYLSLSFILGIGVATWCGCLMQWISKCMDWVLGEDQEWGLRKKNYNL